MILSLPSTFEKTIGETTYAIDARPVQLVLFASLASAVLPRRSGSARRSRRR